MAPAPALRVIQRRPPADDALRLRAERAGDHRGRRTRPAVADDRAGRYAVRTSLWPPARPAPTWVSCRSMPVTTSGAVGFGLKPDGDDGSDRGDGGGEYRFRWPTGRRPCPPIASLARRTRAVRGRLGRPRVGRSSPVAAPRLGRLRGEWRPVRRCAPAGVGGPSVGQIRRRLAQVAERRPIAASRADGLPQRVLRAGRRANNSAPSIPEWPGVAWCTGFGGWHRCLLDNGVRGARHAVRRRRRAPRSAPATAAISCSTNRLVSIAASLSGRAVVRIPWDHAVLEARTAFISPSAPAADWVMAEVVFTDASAQGPSLPYTSARRRIRWGHPPGVPGPCASTMPTMPGLRPHPTPPDTRDLLDRDSVAIDSVAVLVGGRAAVRPGSGPHRPASGNRERQHDAALTGDRNRPRASNA